MNGDKIQIKHKKGTFAETVLSKALKGLKSQGSYEIRDKYLKELKDENLNIFDKVINQMNKEILEVLE